MSNSSSTWLQTFLINEYALLRSFPNRFDLVFSPPLLFLIPCGECNVRLRCAGLLQKERCFWEFFCDANIAADNDCILRGNCLFKTLYDLCLTMTTSSTSTALPITKLMAKTTTKHEIKVVAQ